MNSPNPADTSGDAIGGVLTRRVWSPTTGEMLNHVTRDWRNHYVTAEVLSYEELSKFVVRPFVLVVSLDAPVLERFRRMTRYSRASFADERGFDPCSPLDCRLAKRHVSLEKFIFDHDTEVYGPQFPKVRTDGSSSIQELQRLVHLRIDNPFKSISEFHAHLDSLDLLNVDRLRPKWDTYFMVRTTVPPFLSPSFPLFPTLILGPVSLPFLSTPPPRNHNHIGVRRSG